MVGKLRKNCATLHSIHSARTLLKSLHTYLNRTIRIRMVCIIDYRPLVYRNMIQQKSILLFIA